MFTLTHTTGDVMHDAGIAPCITPRRLCATVGLATGMLTVLLGATVAMAVDPTQTTAGDSQIIPGASLPLPALDSGPGVVVCEPVADDPALASFGAGCSMWLHYVIGSRPGLGKTPPWADVEKARKDLKLTSLCLKESDAAGLRKILGVTAVLTGRIAPSAGQNAQAGTYTLSYAITATPSSAAGLPLSITGDRAAIVQALPGLASQILQRIQAQADPPPPPVGIGADDLAFLGEMPWLPDAPLSGPALKRLDALSAATPLAGLLYLNNTVAEQRGDQALNSPISRLIAGHSDSPLVLAEVARVAPGWLPLFQGAVQANATRWPNNALTNLAMASLSRQQKDWQAGVSYAERAVRCARGNAFLWLFLSRAFVDVEIALSHGDMPIASGWVMGPDIQTIAQQMKVAAQNVVELDPACAWGLITHSEACYYLHAMPDSRTDCGKAMPVGWEDPTIYYWLLFTFNTGRQADTNYQKWIADQGALAPLTSVQAARDLAATLNHFGMAAQAQGLADKVIQRLAARALQDPGDYGSRWLLATAMRDSGNKDAAIEEFRSIAETYPNDSQAHTQLGAALLAKGLADEAITELHRAITLDPDDALAQRLLTDALLDSGHPHQALAQAQAAFKQSPQDLKTLFALASLDTVSGRVTEGNALFTQALRESPNQPLVQAGMAVALIESGDFTGALKAARKAVALDPQSPAAQAALGWALIRQKPTDPVLEGVQ